MKQDAAAYLGLPEGTIEVIQNMTKGEAVAEMSQIMDEWERHGYHTMNEAPDGPVKDEFKALARALGVRV